MHRESYYNTILIYQPLPEKGPQDSCKGLNVLILQGSAQEIYFNQLEPFGASGAFHSKGKQKQKMRKICENISVSAISQVDMKQPAACFHDMILIGLGFHAFENNIAIICFSCVFQCSDLIFSTYQSQLDKLSLTSNSFH